MPLNDSVAHNDAPKNAPPAESSPAQLEAWASIKNFVMNKVTDRTAPTVLRGEAGWGNVNLSLAPGHIVEGTFEAESGSMRSVGVNQFEGHLPWGSANLKFEKGNLSGVGPWGNIKLKVDATSVSGDVPWGKINLTLRGQELSGATPWGTAHLHLGDRYKSLTNPDVLAALSAVMADR